MPEDVAIDTRALADRVRDLVGARRLAQVRALLADLTVHDIAEAFRHLDYDVEAVAFRVLPRELASQVFEYL
ncbi:MAG TPA: hypothetical protein VFF08_09490, partial [Trueperaceae bacterium]|nr:hypothetical protein [Trueperaceae bacterium]